MATKRSAPKGKTADRAWAFYPLTPDRWHDFENLLGPHGAAGGCWCMWWRLTKAQFDAQKGEGNRKAMKAIVDSGQVPGILAYHRGEPVAWCSVAPRGHFPRLERSRLLRPIDREPVWSVVCFFVSRPHRRSGVATRLLRAAVAYAKTKGARIVEGYPVELKQRRYPDLFAYHGVASAFRRVGFKEAAHPSETRLVMRYAVE